MKVKGRHYRALWMEGSTLCMINQNMLPFSFEIYRSKSIQDTCTAITTMITRGAGSIGAAGAYGMLQAILNTKDKDIIAEAENAKKMLDSTRPTAANLFYATNRVFEALKISEEFAISEAMSVADECVEQSKLIGEHGNKLIKNGYKIETHCNAGWLALVDYGSALAPIYTAYDNGKNIFVYVDQTGPRNQGGRLTAWELHQHGVPHAIIPDNAGAYYMSKNQIDLIIVGADRIVANGDTANKIGTLEKAIAAKYYNIPFYVAAPLSTFDMNIKTGKSIPIEERSQNEVNYATGLNKNKQITDVLISNPDSEALNPAFDVTPAELITGIITEKGIIEPNNKTITKLFEK